MFGKMAILLATLSAMLAIIIALSFSFIVHHFPANVVSSFLACGARPATVNLKIPMKEKQIASFQTVGSEALALRRHHRLHLHRTHADAHVPSSVHIAQAHG